MSYTSSVPEFQFSIPLGAAMIDAVWLQVFERIPADSYDSLSIVTTTGSELVVQQVFKLERDFVVVRARTAGTMDTGRTIIVAFAQIDYVAFNKKMSEEDVMAIFGAPMPEIAPPQTVVYQAAPASGTIPFAPSPRPATPRPATPKPALRPPAPAKPVAAEAPPEPPAEPASQPKPGQISKTLLLARLRERLAEKGAK